MAGESVHLPVLAHNLTSGNVDQYRYVEIHQNVAAANPDALTAAAITYGAAREAFAKSQGTIAGCASQLACAWSGDSADEAWRQLSQLHDAASVLATHSETFQGALTDTAAAIKVGQAELASTYDPGFGQGSDSPLYGYAPGVASPGLANRQHQMDIQARQQLARINAGIHDGVSKAPTNVNFTVPSVKRGETPYSGQSAGSAGGGAGGQGIGARGFGGGGPQLGSGGSNSPGGGSHLQGGHSSGGLGPAGNPGLGPGDGTSPSPGGMPGPGGPGGRGWIGPGSGLGPGGVVGNGLGGRGLGGGFDGEDVGAGGFRQVGSAGTGGAVATEDGILNGQAAEARGTAALEAGVLRGPVGAGGVGMPIMGGPAGGEVSRERNPSPWLLEDDDVWSDQADVAPPVIG